MEENDEEKTKKNKGGRVAKVPVEEQLEAYRSKSENLLDSSNKILPASANIYDELADKFEHKMTARAIQLSVTKHAKEIFGDVVQSAEPNESAAINDECDEFADYDEDGMTVTLTVHEKYAETFKIVSVEPRNAVRSHKILRPGWADALHRIIVDQTDTDCVFQFKRANVVGEEFTANAVCGECGDSLTAKSFGNRKRITIDIVRGEGEHSHTKRRRLTTVRAKTLIPALKADTVYNVHSELVNEYNPESDFVPRDYISQKSLENVKHQYINKRANSVAALRDMKYNEYFDIIKEIGTDPFFVMFWTPAQKFVYMQNAKKGRSIISIDATGGLISNQPLVAELSKKVKLPHIFLYLICLKVHDSRSIPVAQFLSAQHDTTKIKYFLQRFVEDFGQPDEIILDEGAALQKACAQIFGDSENIADYTRKCFAVLNGDALNSGVDSRPPQRFIRNDVSHFVHNVHKNKAFNSIGAQAKHFYKCVIGAIMQISSYEEIKVIVKDILIMANYPIEGVNEDGTEVPTTESRIRLQRLIKTHDTSFFSVETETNENEILLSETDSEDENVCHDSSSISWFTGVLNEIEEKVKSIEFSPSNMSSNVSINNYKCIALNVYLQDLLSKLPLWSCVMCAHFQAPNALGNSCNVERQYSLIKSNIFHQYTLPVNSVVFLEIFIKRINSVTTLMKMRLKQSVKQTEEEEQEGMDIDENPEEQMHAASTVSNISFICIFENELHSPNGIVYSYV